MFRRQQEAQQVLQQMNVFINMGGGGNVFMNMGGCGFDGGFGGGFGGF
jgi:hypothetical protein